MQPTAPAASAPAAGRVNFVTGIRVQFLNLNLIEKCLADSRVSYTSDQDTEQLSVLLFDHFSKLPKEKLVRCVRCRGISDDDLDACPYCGHDTVEGLVAESAAPAPTVAKQEAPTMTNASAEPTNGAAKLTKPAKADKIARTEADLDTAVHNIHRLKGEGAAALYRVGKEIARVYENQLWKLRVAKDDKGTERPRWKSFEAFCNEELQMTPENAHSLRDVAEHYTEEQVTAFGTTKLGLILRAPAEDRSELEEKVKAGASTRQIREEVTKRKKKTGHIKASRNKRTAKATEASAKKARSKPADKTITVAKVLTSALVKFYVKPATMPKSLSPDDVAKLKRATKIGDGCIGVLALTNGVTEWFNVFTSATGEIAMKVVRKRDD